MAFKLPTSNVLVLGSNSVHCLLPSTLITRADALLAAHRLEDAVELADQQLKKLQGRVTLDTEEADELRYVYQRIGFQCLTETLFDDAGKHFFAGNLDPRILISYYPELRGSLFSPDDAVDMFAGVTEHMPSEDSIDDIISTNLVMNYSPHLSPNTSTAPVAVELRGVLKVAATEMLKVFLRKWRAKRRDREIEKVRVVPRETRRGRTVNEVVDTVLAKLYTAGGETTDLLALIEGPNDIVVEEVETSLSQSSRYDALCKLYRSRGEDEKLLKVWAKLVTGEVVDEDVHDPLESMFAYLTEKKDKALIQEWGVWLLKWDSERALKLLTSIGGSKRGAKTSTADETSLLQRIHESDPTAGVQFIEYLVLQRRSQDPELHTQLATIYVEQLLECVEDESTAKLWRAKLASYTSSSSSTSSSFLGYFASTTPDSLSKRIRLKTLFFLQTSKLYDFDAVKTRLEGAALDAEWAGKVFALERAVVLGKLGHHRDALSLLVHTLHDSASAEAYCTLGGLVIPPKVSQAIAERFDIPVVAPPPPARLTAQEREASVDEGVKRELTKVLLDVYMSAGEAMTESTARLLNAQAMNLDVIDVISDIPPDWPIHVLSSFLSRSFRRTLHAHHEAQLVKALAASENLAVEEASWVILRDAGSIIEEEEEGDASGGDVFGKEKVVSEVEGGALGLSLNEKASWSGTSLEPAVGLRGYDLESRAEEDG